MLFDSLKHAFATPAVPQKHASPTRTPAVGMESLFLSRVMACYGGGDKGQFGWMEAEDEGKGWG